MSPEHYDSNIASLEVRSSNINREVPEEQQVDWPAALKKLEQAGQSLLKQGRELLRSGDKLVSVKPYLKGLLVGCIPP